MQIYGPTHAHGPQSINTPQRAHSMQSSAQPDQARGMDQLDISPEADFLSRVRDISDIRVDRVTELRAAIESGTYETAGKLDLAVERLLDELA
jgi:negative regulator of flagellin synthesis FlgM